ncbi:MAG: DUF3795 domain-containing protein [Deltaproteobacteria bacterium]|nr:DUF3795 domain-containing protein [Deltaproteobacteria bacterium]
MRDIIADKNLVAKCGLYCGACRAYLKEKCPGCAEAKNRGWCKTRSCCAEHSLASCADCTDFADPKQCSRFYNFVSRFFGVVFRSDRPACVAAIKTLGYDAYAADMATKKRQSVPRK